MSYKPEKESEDSSSFFSEKSNYNNYINSNFPLIKYASNYFLCKECHAIPLIEIKSNSVLIKCQHIKEDRNDRRIEEDNLIQNIRFKDLRSYLFEKSERYIDNMKCKHHNKKYDYCYYDTNEKRHKNFCLSCPEFNNEDIKNKFRFDIINSDFNSKINRIIKVFNLDVKEMEISFDKNDENILLKQFIATILNNYIEYPNYNQYKNIENLNNFAESNIIIKTSNDNINKTIIINSSRELENKVGNKDQLKCIEYIKIYQSDFSEMKLLVENYSFLIKLTRLELKQNNIKSLENLIKCEFPNLEILSLQTNLIDNTNIKFFRDFKDKFPKLKDLNLDGNNLTDYEFFESIQTLNNLTKLNVSRNCFRLPNNNTNYTHKIKLQNINEMILSNGVFNDNSINKILVNFEIEAIEIIDLSSNNLKSLRFMGNVKWPLLNKIILNNNDLDNIEILDKFENLKNIELINNLFYDTNQFKTIQNNISNLQIKSTLAIKENDNINIININESRNNTIIINATIESRSEQSERRIYDRDDDDDDF